MIWVRLCIVKVYHESVFIAIIFYQENSFNMGKFCIQGEDVAIEKAVDAIDECLREPPGPRTCSTVLWWQTNSSLQYGFYDFSFYNPQASDTDTGPPCSKLGDLVCEMAYDHHHGFSPLVRAPALPCFDGKRSYLLSSTASIFDDDGDHMPSHKQETYQFRA